MHLLGTFLDGIRESRRGQYNGVRVCARVCVCFQPVCRKEFESAKAETKIPRQLDGRGKGVVRSIMVVVQSVMGGKIYVHSLTHHHCRIGGA